LTIVVVKVHVPQKENKTVTEVARVRQRTLCVLPAASVELAKLLARIGYVSLVCESNVLDGVFYSCLHNISHYI
jgi:hypothetical protein